jgi:hypothetical protein
VLVIDYFWRKDYSIATGRSLDSWRSIAPSRKTQTDCYLAAFPRPQERQSLCQKRQLYKKQSVMLVVGGEIGPRHFSM